jgi:hypothetical protein
MNDQSIQFMRENLANLVRLVASRSERPSVGPPFIHSRRPNTSPRTKRKKISKNFIPKYLSNCEQFYYTILSAEKKNS